MSELFARTRSHRLDREPRTFTPKRRAYPTPAKAMTRPAKAMTRRAHPGAALLAHSIGAAAEAQHHLGHFERIAPNSAESTELRALLAKAPANPPTHTFTLGQPAPNAASATAPAAPSGNVTPP